MALRIVNGDLFQTAAPVICHQVNCRGKMGSGVARQIRNLYPAVYEQYQRLCNQEKGNPRRLLGQIQYICCKDVKNETGVRSIVNIFAQDMYGYDGRCYTDYEAFERCLEELKHIVCTGSTIAMPYKIGCGLAGGDWNTVYGIIDRSLGSKYAIELWRKEDK